LRKTEAATGVEVRVFGAGTGRTGVTAAIRYAGGPTAVIELGGLRLLTDPTFDPPGDHPVGTRRLTKTAGPAFGPEAVEPVDGVLLSHDQHSDNLDRLGRELLGRAPLVLSTPAAAERLGGNVRALRAWERVVLPRPDAGALEVTAVPARHGPEGAERLAGEVTGFALAGAGLPTVYVSGDNASVALVCEIAARLGAVDVAVLFAGAARTALLDGAPLTLTGELAAEAARVLGARLVVPLHFEGWAHFSEGREALVEAFGRAGLADRLRLPAPGERIELG
jgi:L-ascorbate metabolism protein UlaG (beta-lactamase superfamily)